MALVAAMPLFAIKMVWIGLEPPPSTYFSMRARLLRRRSTGRLWASIIAVMDDVRWRPEDLPHDCGVLFPEPLR